MPTPSRFRLALGVAAVTLTIPLFVLADTQQPTNSGPAHSTASSHDSAEQKVDGPTKPLEVEGIHNVFQWTPKIISGSCPFSEAGYKALAARGVKTIVTVDGAQPDVAVARKYGMRYVHIPVEYSGIERVDALRIVRAVRDLPGPIFIHCHHGMHRGPAAAAIAAIGTGGYTNAQAEAGLKQAGTGANYKGLWANAHDFKKPTKKELKAAGNDFLEVAKVEAFSAHMVNIDNRWANLGDVRKANWKVPADHPDIDPPHEALLLREGFTEMIRSKDMERHSPEMMKGMVAAESAAAALETALRANDTEKAAAAYDAVTLTCSDCHKLYRDNKPME